MKTNSDKAATSQQTMKYVGHCLYRAQISGIYYAILKRSGKQIKRSLKTADQALAKRRLADLQDRAERLSSGNSSRVAFEILANRWLEAAGTAMKRSSYERQVLVLKALNRYLGAAMVRSISKGMIEGWAAKRSKEVSARTVNYERQTWLRIIPRLRQFAKCLADGWSSTASPRFNATGAHPQVPLIHTPVGIRVGACCRCELSFCKPLAML